MMVWGEETEAEARERGRMEALWRGTLCAYGPERPWALALFYLVALGLLLAACDLGWLRV